MESYLLLGIATFAIMICVPLIVLMARRGFAWYVRLYVSLFGVSAMLMSQAAVTGQRIFGYLPEIMMAGLVAIGFLIALVTSVTDRDTGSSRTAGVFRSLF